MQLTPHSFSCYNHGAVKLQMENCGLRGYFCGRKHILSTDGERKFNSRGDNQYDNEWSTTAAGLWFC